MCSTTLRDRRRRKILIHLRDDEDAALEGLERLLAVERFAADLDHVHWFAKVGQPLENLELTAAEHYLAAMGATDVAVGLVADWEQAAQAGESPGFNTPWWEAEEMLRTGLTTDALEIVDESEFKLALTRLTERASKSATLAAEEAALLSGVSDPGLVRAAAGAAVQACHLRALVDLGGEDATHAFAYKFELFEEGRWPIAVTGGTFHLF